MAGVSTDTDLIDRVRARVKTEPAPDGLINAQRNKPRARVWTLPGIHSSTRLSTTMGNVPANLVRVRDKLRTRDNGFLPVLRIDEYKFDAEFLSLHPEARPIRFTASAVGTKGSDAKVLLSPGQSVLARDDAGQETLRIASEFLARPGIMAEPGGAFSYFVFHLGQAALVKAEGMWVSLGE